MQSDREQKIETDALDKRVPLSYSIIGAAIEVHRFLGPGLLESVYEDTICVELDDRNIKYERQKRIELEYKGQRIGNLFADIIVENRLIVEVKSVQSLAPIHSAQLITYLKLRNIKTGLLINFNVPILRDGIKRIVF